MSEENIITLKEQSNKIRIEEIMRCIRILQETEEQSKWSKQSRIYLELAIIKMCKFEYDTSNEVILARLNKVEKIIKSGSVSLNNESTLGNVKEEIKRAAKQIKKAEPIQEVEESFVNNDSKITLEDVKKVWKDIIETFKARRLRVLGAHLTNGEPISCKGSIIEIRFEKNYNFSKQNLQRQENNKKVEEIFSEVLKERVKIKYSVENSEESKVSPEEILKQTFGEEIVDIIDE